jgi:ssDNA-binding Zn-finger/Zn-ribbon topoisomerase 1
MDEPIGKCPKCQGDLVMKTNHLQEIGNFLCCPNNDFCIRLADWQRIWSEFDNAIGKVKMKNLKRLTTRLIEASIGK